MRSTFVIIILSSLLFQYCDKTTFSYLETKNYFVFNLGDTLIYRGANDTDTFCVAEVEKSFRNVDKRLNIENWRINIRELTNNCTESTYDYCWGMIIIQDAENPTDLTFRNDYSSSVESSPIIKYVIGNFTLNDVYTVNFRVPSKVNQKDVRRVYYTYNYGIIAYELINGEKIELEEKYLQHQ